MTYGIGQSVLTRLALNLPMGSGKGLSFSNEYQLFAQPPQHDLSSSNFQLDPEFKDNVYQRKIYIGENEDIDEVISADTATLDEIGISFDEIADALQEFINIAESVSKLGLCRLKEFNHSFTIGDFKIKLIRWMGSPPCACGLKFFRSIHPFDFFLENRRNGRKLFISPLHSHLIREHHYFEGKKVLSYRLEPLAVILTLGLSSPYFSEEELEEKLMEQLKTDLQSNHLNALFFIKMFRNLPGMKLHGLTPVVSQSNASFACPRSSFSW